MSAVTDLLATIDSAINTIVLSPDGIADYRLGQKSVSRSQILARLLDARRLYQELAVSEPYEDVRHIAWDTDRFGFDISELVGDAAT